MTPLFSHKNLRAGKRKKSRKSKLAQSQRWVRPLHAYSSMLMLFILLFFTLTGLTLNNRQWLPSPNVAEGIELALPQIYRDMPFNDDEAQSQGREVWQWLKQEQSLSDGELSVQWLAEDSLLILDVKRPGGYSMAEISVDESRVWYENQHLGWMAVVNDLHMGRYSGKVWGWFIDVSAVVMLLFTLTGFWLVLFHRKRRSRVLLLSGLGTLIMFGLYLGMLL